MISVGRSFPPRRRKCNHHLFSVTVVHASNKACTIFAVARLGFQQPSRLAFSKRRARVCTATVHRRNRNPCQNYPGSLAISRFTYTFLFSFFFSSFCPRTRSECKKIHFPSSIFNRKIEIVISVTSIRDGNPRVCAKERASLIEI